MGFTGVVFYADDFFCQCFVNVHVGSPLVGYIVYDTAVADTDPSPNQGVYEFTTVPNGFVVWVGGHEYRSDPLDTSMRITVRDSLLDGSNDYDAFLVWERNPIDSRLFEVQNFFLWLTDYSASAVNNDSLPEEPLRLDDWPTFRQLQVKGSDFDIRATLLYLADSAPTGIQTPPLEESSWGRIKALYR
jgi:hypothetical protein